MQRIFNFTLCHPQRSSYTVVHWNVRMTCSCSTPSEPAAHALGHHGHATPWDMTRLFFPDARDGHVHSTACVSGQLLDDVRFSITSEQLHEVQVQSDGRLIYSPPLLHCPSVVITGWPSVVHHQPKTQDALLSLGMYRNATPLLSLPQPLPSPGWKQSLLLEQTPTISRLVADGGPLIG